VRSLIHEVNCLLETREKFIMICDLRAVSKPANAAQRQMMAAWLSAPHIVALVKEVLVGTAILIRNPIVRGAFTAVTWIAPLPAPAGIFEDIALAAGWVRRRCTEEQLHVTVRLDRVLSSEDAQGRST
jgi:hypothetical protein